MKRCPRLLVSEKTSISCYGGAKGRILRYTSTPVVRTGTSISSNTWGYGHKEDRSRDFSAFQISAFSTLTPPRVDLPSDVEYTTDPSRRRPRLQQLREKLKHDKNKVIAKQTTPIRSRDHHDKNDFSLKESSTLSVSEHVDELKMWLDKLPSPNPASSLLTDRFERQHKYVRISLTERCNLRCTYCMPADGVPLQPSEKLLSTPEILQLASFFSHHGVRKFRLTGGEPTLRRDIVDILLGLNQLHPQQLGMTTNGVTLAKNLNQYIEAGLNSVNISLDTLDPEQFERLTRRPASYLDRVWEAIEAATHPSVNTILSTKINCVVTPSNLNQLPKLIQLTETFPSLTVRFIEFMPFTANGWDTSEFVSFAEMLESLRMHGNNMELLPDPSTDPSDTTKYYRTSSGGRVGFITSMSQNFCSTCNRLRITADGQLKVCLFDGRTQHVSLRDALRHGLDMEKLVWAALQTKEYALGGHEDAVEIAKNSSSNRPMTLIGG